MNAASIKAFLQRSARAEASPAPDDWDAAEMGTAFGLELSFALPAGEAPSRDADRPRARGADGAVAAE